MDDKSEIIHVHRGDVAYTIEQYRLRGFALKERAQPTIMAQKGFVKLTFVPADELPPTTEVEEPPKKKRFFFF